MLKRRRVENLEKQTIEGYKEEKNIKEEDQKENDQENDNKKIQKSTRKKYREEDIGEEETFNRLHIVEFKGKINE